MPNTQEVSLDDMVKNLEADADKASAQGNIPADGSNQESVQAGVNSDNPINSNNVVNQEHAKVEQKPDIPVASNNGGVNSGNPKESNTVNIGGTNIEIKNLDEASSVISKLQQQDSGNRSVQAQLAEYLSQNNISPESVGFLKDLLDPSTQGNALKALIVKNKSLMEDLGIDDENLKNVNYKPSTVPIKEPMEIAIEEAYANPKTRDFIDDLVNNKIMYDEDFAKAVSSDMSLFNSLKNLSLNGDYDYFKKELLTTKLFNNSISPKEAFVKAIENLKESKNKVDNKPMNANIPNSNNNVANSPDYKEIVEGGKLYTNYPNNPPSNFAPTPDVYYDENNNAFKYTPDSVVNTAQMGSVHSYPSVGSQQPDIMGSLTVENINKIKDINTIEKLLKQLSGA